MTIDACPECEGARLRREARHYKVKDATISDLARMDLGELGEWMETAEEGMDKRTTLIAIDILKEIRFRLRFLLHVGLGYLSLDRPGRSLSGGEAQRIRLATQIGSQLTGITYILDEPSIGLHREPDNWNLPRPFLEHQGGLVPTRHHKYLPRDVPGPQLEPHARRLKFHPIL